MHRSNLVIMLAALVAGAPSAYAQAQKSAPSAGVTGGVVVASEPGKAAVMATIEVTASITAIDKATRMVTLKGPKRTVEIVAGDDVKNFEQLKVGDNVTVKFVEALTLELKKTMVKPDIKADVAAVRATPGAKPGGAIGRQVTIMAEVVMVDPENSIIALKGPQGRLVELPVQNKDQFKVVKKGDQVEVVYTEAVALAVTPAAAKPANAKQ